MHVCNYLCVSLKSLICLNSLISKAISEKELDWHSKTKLRDNYTEKSEHLMGWKTKPITK